MSKRPSHRTAKQAMHRIALVASVTALFCSILFLLGVFGRYEHQMTDALYGGKQASPNIVIIGIDDKSLQEIGRWPWDRRNFTVVLERTEQASLIGMDLAFLERSSPDADASLAQAIAAGPESRAVVLVSEYTSFSTDVSGNVIGEGLLRPVISTDVRTGFANIVNDADGVVRSLNPAISGEQAFSAMLYEAYIGDRYPPTQQLLINFPGAPGSFKRYSASDVIAGRIPEGEFKDKIVLVGADAADFHDDAIVPTSHGHPMPGVEIHASALQTMLLGQELAYLPSWMTIIGILLSVAIVAFLMHRLHAVLAGAIAIAMIVLDVMLAFLLFERGIIMHILYLILAIVLAFITISLVQLVDERLAKRKISDAFGQYVNPHILEQILRSDVRLGGERRELSILFSDVRGFTGISEGLSPEELVEFINGYFDRATREIMSRDGLVDKFIGDAIMAFWNAPVRVHDHATNAVLAALAMRDAVRALRDDPLHSRRFPAIDVGIGINTGEAVVGNVGSSRRLSYTAIGDSVNLASRLEGLTKQYGVTIIVSDTTRRKLREDIVVRELDTVVVKGKKNTVIIYEVVGLDEAVSAVERDRIAQYASALRRYYDADWRSAARMFAAVHDAPSNMMRERCERFMRDPPRRWHGAYEMENK